jgi:hypothetical protein
MLFYFNAKSTPLPMRTSKRFSGLLMAGMMSLFSSGSYAQSHNPDEVEKVVRQMFNERNTHFLLVMALQDGFIKEGKSYNFTYSEGNIQVDGETMPEQYARRYQSLLKSYFGRNPSEKADMISIRGDGFTWSEVMDANSKFRKPRRMQHHVVKGADTKEMKKTTDASNAIVDSLFADKLIQSKDRYKLEYTIHGIKVDGRKLDKEMDARYRTIIATLAGFTPKHSGDSYSIEERK